MKTKSTIYTVLLIGLLLTIFFSCKKKDAIKTLPVVTITSVANITANAASSGGDITNDGGATVTARGVCWSTNQTPTTSDQKTSNGTGIGSFTSSVTELTPGTTYYLMAYATNSEGTAYSSQSTFTTLALAPVLTTTEISAVTSTSANSGGNILNDGGSPITARGVCWSTSQNPTTASSKTSDGTGTGSFTSSITGLNPGAIYYIRAYATNSIGTSYGNQVTTTTTALMPTLTTTSISAITSITATSGGTITSDGGVALTARGVCWATTQDPSTANSKTTDGTGTGTFTSNITGLLPGTTYYVRAYATNSIGTVYGSTLSFKSTDVQVRNWLQKADFGGGKIYDAASFVIGNYAYVATGSNNAMYGYGLQRFMYRYDPSFDVWKKMADLPPAGSATFKAVGFAIGEKGYVCGGVGNAALWEYDPATNLWYQRLNFPRVIEEGIGFTISSKAYVGLGGASSIDYKNDFYEYDQSKNKWTQLNDFPGAPRRGSIGFSMDGKGYAGLGYKDIGSYNKSYFKDLWEYDPLTDDWIRLPDFPGEARQDAICFGIDGSIYVGMGDINDFYKYDLKTKEWSTLNYIPGHSRVHAFSFCIGSGIYYGGGMSPNFASDMWKY